MAPVSPAQGLGLRGTGGPGPPSSRSPLGLVSEPHVAAVFPPGGAQGTAAHGHLPEPVAPGPPQLPGALGDPRGPQWLL